MLGVFMLAACGGDGNNSGNNATSTAPDATDTPTTDPAGDSEPGADTTEPADTKIEYTINVTDYKGDPIEDSVFVEISGENGQQFAKTDKTGALKIKLERGNYTFTLSGATEDEGEFYYDESACVLSPESPSVQIALCSVTGPEMEIYPYDAAADDRLAYNAPSVGMGGTYVEIDTKKDMCYFVFTPSIGGVYRIGYVSESALTLKCFGDANFVNENPNVEVDGRAFKYTVQDGSVSNDIGGTFTLVIGVRSMKESSCILTVERIGDVPGGMTYTDVASKEVLAEVERTDHINNSLVNIDVTDKDVKVFYNENDNRYHYGSEDGPVVYVRITSAGPYLASFKEICETASLHSFIYDEEGTPIVRESYNMMIGEYAAICDSNGVCPLTGELATAIQKIGECFGWWDYNNIFTTDEGEDIGLVVENAWLFACCYVKEDVCGASDAPANFDRSENGDFAVALKAGREVYLSAKSAGVFTVENAAGLTVTVNGQSYTADAEGKIVINLSAGARLTVSAESDSEMVFTYKAS